MTENKPIITHGVDVSSCINYACNICTATRDNYGDSFHFCDDIEMKDCYFKQLARKTQECEELKEQYCNGLDGYKICRTLQDVSYYRDKAEQKLEKIQEYCNKYPQNSIGFKKNILQIIDEVE